MVPEPELLAGDVPVEVPCYTIFAQSRDSESTSQDLSRVKENIPFEQDQADSMSYELTNLRCTLYCISKIMTVSNYELEQSIIF